MRGMHYQAAPFEEVCRIYIKMGVDHDVIIDLRPASPTLKQWDAELIARTIGGCCTFSKDSLTASSL